MQKIEIFVVQVQYSSLLSIDWKADYAVALYSVCSGAVEVLDSCRQTPNSYCEICLHIYSSECLHGTVAKKIPCCIHSGKLIGFFETPETSARLLGDNLVTGVYR